MTAIVAPVEDASLGEVFAQEGVDRLRPEAL
jgi:hypothetical protein